jgi:hypothetical protein
LARQYWERENTDKDKWQKSGLFSDYVIVSCGTLAPELNYLRRQGFLDAKRVLYTRPGRHEVPKELESQLTEKIGLATAQAEGILVVYGGKFCYMNVEDPCKSIDAIIRQNETSKPVSRINASHCIDMLASDLERERISGGQKVWWLTPGWVVYRRYVFQDWDKGKANENFPQHGGGAILLDGIDFWGKYSLERPEEILAFSDWMGIEIRPHTITLDRLRNLLLDCVISNLEREFSKLKGRLPTHALKAPMTRQLKYIEEKLEKAKWALNNRCNCTGLEHE